MSSSHPFRLSWLICQLILRGCYGLCVVLFTILLSALAGLPLIAVGVAAYFWIWRGNPDWALYTYIALFFTAGPYMALWSAIAGYQSLPDSLDLSAAKTTAAMEAFGSFHRRLWAWSASTIKRATLFSCWWVGVGYLGWICAATLCPILVITAVIVDARSGTMSLFTLLAALLPCAISLAVVRIFPPAKTWAMAKSYWRGVPFILETLTFGVVREPKTAHWVALITTTLAIISASATYTWTYAIPNAAAESEFAPLKEAYFRQGDPDPEMSKWITYLSSKPYLDFAKRHAGTKSAEKAREMGAKLHQAEVAKILNYANLERHPSQIDMVYAGSGAKRDLDPGVLSRLYYNGWMLGGRGAWTYEDADYYRQLIEKCALDDNTLPELRVAYREIVRGVMRNKIAAAGLGPPEVAHQERLPARPGIETKTPTEYRAAVADGKKEDFWMMILHTIRDSSGSSLE